MTQFQKKMTAKKINNDSPTLTKKVLKSTWFTTKTIITTDED